MRLYVYIFFVIVFLLSCTPRDSKNYVWHTKDVMATAYNSLASQTNAQPSITAFGDTLSPGLKYIAVSRDLLALGLKHNALVTIKGLDGVYLVKDKMHSRWKNKIDIYMGTDVKAAREWGRKKVTITYRLEVKEPI